MVTLPNPVRDSISVTDAVRIEEPATQRYGIPSGIQHRSLLHQESKGHKI